MRSIGGKYKHSSAAAHRGDGIRIHTADPEAGPLPGYTQDMNT